MHRTQSLLAIIGAAALAYLALAPPAWAQTDTVTITNTLALQQAKYYTTTLPSGGSAAVVMTATAGELGIISLLGVLAAIMTFNTLRDVFRRVKATS